jgi:hypothetical protein
MNSLEIHQTHHPTSSLPRGEPSSPSSPSPGRFAGVLRKGGGIDTALSLPKCPKRKTGRAFCVFLDFYKDGSYNLVKIQVGFISICSPVGNYWYRKS